MSVAVSDVLRRAVAHHQRGEYSMARGLYESILDSDPCHADALHLLGVLHCQSGAAGVGVPLIERALSERPGQLDYYVNLGVVYQQQGDVRGEIVVQERLLSVCPGHVGAQRRLFALYRAAGDVSSALRMGQRLSELEPEDAVLQNNVGHLQQQRGDLSGAIASYRRAVLLQPGFALAYNNLGNALCAAGDIEGGQAACRRAVELQSDYAEAWNNLGIACDRAGDQAEAVQCYRRAVELKPQLVAALVNLGHALHEQGQPGDGEVHIREALRLDPDLPEAHNNLGIIQQTLGNLAEAEHCYRRAIALNAKFAEAHNNLGNILQEQGDARGALQCFERACQLRPDYAEAYCHCGNALRLLGDCEAAIQAYQHALQLKPALEDAWANLGSLLFSLERNPAARDAYRRLIELNPTNADYWNGLGKALQALGDLPDAAECFRRTLELRPAHAAAAMQLTRMQQQECCWTEMSEHLQTVRSVLQGEWSGSSADLVPPFSLMNHHDTACSDLLLSAAVRWCEHTLRTTGLSGKSERRSVSRFHATETSRPRRDRVRLGYLSADYRQHPVGLLSVELFELHDRDRFEVYGYSYGPDDGSGVRSRISGAFDVFRDVRGLSHVEAARQIADDGVDILVDLTGYTQHSRTEILAYRPSPVQVNYLGYPGTLGADFMDYILVDDYIVPPDQQAYFTERLVHLPGCYLPNDSRLEISSETPSRAACGLPADGFVFCAFNNSYKITPAMFSVWMRLLQAVPGSVLWLREQHRGVSENLRREAEQRGVSGERLVFAATCRNQGDHMARYRHADLFLDTYPFNAHTTASDSLRMCVPLLTVSGDTFASRVAGSLLRAVGLSDLIAGDLSEYERQALSLALDGDRLSSVRSRLIAGIASSGIFGGGCIVRDLERAYSVMWEQHLSGAGPRGFRLSGSGGSAAEVHR